MSANANRALVRRYYEDLWNAWNFSLIEEILAPDITFRGSLGVVVQGRRAYAQYMRNVQNAFPDFVNIIDDIIAEKDKVVVRMTYRATHRGPVFGIGATEQKIEYTAAGIFQVARGQITDGWIMADVLALLRQLGAAPPLP